MKIVQVITRSDMAGGATTHVLDLSSALLREGHEVQVLLGGAGPVTDTLRARGIPFRPMRHLARDLSALRDLRAVREMTGVLRELRPDLVATHTAKAGAVGRLAAVIVGIPSVYTAHGWSIADRISPRKGSIFTQVERCSGLFSKRIINVSYAERRLALEKKIAGRYKLAVIHNGVPDVPYRADPGETPPRIVMVARFARDKDHATLLHALAALKSAHWSAELIGDGPSLPSIRQIASDLGLAGRVVYSGQCQSVASRLAEAQIFALTTYTEGFPISILEAMRAGLPVIATDTGGIPEQVSDGVTGLLVKRQDAASVANALGSLISDAPLRRKMGHAGRRRYEEHFTFQAMYSATLAVYRQCAANHSRRTSADAQEILTLKGDSLSNTLW